MNVKALLALLGAGGLAGSLASQWVSGLINWQSTQPGALPGTGEPAAGYYPAGTEDMVREGSQYDARIGLLPAQWEENRSAVEGQAGYLDQVVGLMRESKLGPLGDDITEMRTSFEDYAGGVEGAEGKDPYSQRMKRHRALSDDLTGRISALNEEVSGNFRKTISDPTIMTEAEMDTIVGRMIGSNREAATARMRGYENDAGARGLSEAAVRALSERAAQANRSQNLQSIASVAEVDAINRAKLEQEANAALGTIGGELLTREGNVAGMFEGMDERLVSQVLPMLLGMEKDVGETYENRLANSLLDRGALEQPENIMILGDMLAETGRFNTLLRSGAFAELANALGTYGGSNLEWLSSTLDREEMQDYQDSQSSVDWMELVKGGATAGLSFL